MRSQILPWLGLAATAIAFPASSAVDVEDVGDRWSLDDMDVEDLVPISPSGSLSKRRDNLELRSNLRLLWGNSNTQATLDADFPGADENVINMEDFGDLLEAVDCTPPQLSLDFVDRQSLDDAMALWGWVNEKTERSFLMIVNHPRCGSQAGGRVPYNITNVSYDHDRHIAYLDAAEVDYESAIHDGHLVVETAAQPVVSSTNGTVVRRAGTARLSERMSVSKTVSLDHDFSGNVFDLPVGDAGAGVRLDCTDCTSEGDVKLKLDVRISWFQLKHVYLEFTAYDVRADVNLALEASASKTFSGTQELWSYDAVGVSIPGIARLGFGPAVGLGWSASLGGEGVVEWGASAKLTPYSKARICMKGCDTWSEGWEVDYSSSGPTASGSLGADVNIHTYMSLSAGAKLFGLSYEGGVALLAPEFEGSLDAIFESDGGVCGQDASTFGLDAELSIGAEAFAYIGKNHISTDERWDIFDLKYPLLSECYTF